MYDLSNIMLGKLMKNYRESRNISVTQLAKMVSKSKSTISKYESGVITPDIVTLIEICNALNINLNDLLPQTINSNKNTTLNNLFKSSKLYFYYYTQDHLVTSVAELSMDSDVKNISVRFFNGIKDIKKYADKSSYYYEGSLIYDNTVGYINLENINAQGTQYEKIQISFIIPWNKNIDKTFFFIIALTPHSIPVVKKGIMSTTELPNALEYNNYLKISKEDIRKIKYHNAWILNDSNYDDLFFAKK